MNQKIIWLRILFNASLLLVLMAATCAALFALAYLAYGVLP